MQKTRPRSFRPSLALSLLGLIALVGPALGQTTQPQAQAERVPLRFIITYDGTVADSYSGRVYVMLSERNRQPRFGPSWFNTEPFYAVDVEDWRPQQPLLIDDPDLAFPGPLCDLPAATYWVQAVMRRNPDSPRIGTGEGTAYSAPARFEINGETGGEVALRIDQLVPPYRWREEPRLKSLIENERLEVVKLRSELLSEFYGRDIFMEAAVYLPADYDADESVRYPALYIIPGFGGSHLQAAAFAGRASGEDSNRIVKIGLNPLCRTGHHVFADSHNNGPRGRALVEEFIPYLEEQFRLVGAATARFLTGGSSGGWSSLWLQVTYPDFFAGVWSMVPDPVDFRDFQRINLYESDVNMYVDEEGNRRPIARMGDSAAMWYEPFARMELVYGEGGQLYSFDAVFSPRGPDGRPMALFDHGSGVVDPNVAEAWKRYDIRLILEENWATLGPKLAGKLHIFAGEQDNFYLEGAVKLLKASLEKLASDAVVEIIPGRNHMTVADRAMVERIDRDLLAIFQRHHGGPTTRAESEAPASVPAH